ncbi:hypothetical protein DAI22_02g391466 [Oryza sativa Japonica Group]|nr:hypothetical protein DAI22_02g391466 [Oryza sativa Japonica Group]
MQAKQPKQTKQPHLLLPAAAGASFFPLLFSPAPTTHHACCLPWRIRHKQAGHGSRQPHLRPVASKASWPWPMVGALPAAVRPAGSRLHRSSLTKLSPELSKLPTSSSAR